MKSRIILLFLTIMVCLGCKTGSQNQFSTDFTEGKPLSEVTDRRLKEVSGLIASVANPGFLWAVTDSGNDAEIFLVDKNLDIKMTVKLTGARNRDWEDIAIGAGPDSSRMYIYVADIGDNEAAYPYKHLYRLVEPSVSEGTNLFLSEFDKIDFKLEDEVKDTESIFIDADSRDIYVISKREQPVSVYLLKYPQPVGDTITAAKVLSLPFKEIVAADCFSKSGDILMKNYSSIYYWKNEDGTDPLTLMKRKPVEVPYKVEPQGESIAWAADGSGFFTLSERKKKQPSYLYFYSKKSEH